jgi:hypothetical protein
LFLLDGKKLLRLTHFDRSDTFGGFVDRRRVLLGVGESAVRTRPIPALLRQRIRWLHAVCPSHL